jgi:hypothetical protein
MRRKRNKESAPQILRRAFFEMISGAGGPSANDPSALSLAHDQHLPQCRNRLRLVARQ